MMRSQRMVSARGPAPVYRTLGLGRNLDTPRTHAPTPRSPGQRPDTIPALRAFTPQTLHWRVCKTAFTPMGRALRTHPEVRAMT